MGSWGTRSFDNDAAMELPGDLAPLAVEAVDVLLDPQSSPYGLGDDVGALEEWRGELLAIRAHLAPG